MKQSFLILFLCSAFSFAQQQATGYVFEDTNKNGIKDRKEKGIANVSVSNGVDLVKTDETGKYTLPVENDNIIFVIKPANYATPKSNTQLPQFYYIHKPEGSPKDMKYAGVKPTGKLPKEINFPLYAQKENTQFKVLVFGDPQP
ncbi:MAG: metallophosphoesterase, partial [Cloacibacterium sp.]|nr:metallophosphoesterase [Cloacibacterium sp.]